MTVTGPLWEALGAAVHRVGAQQDVLRSDLASPDELAAVASQLADAVGRAAEGRLDPDHPLPRSALARRVLALLRAAFLDHAAGLSPAPDAAAVLRMFQAFEAVAAGLEPLWHERFEERLSGPDGLELVVEVAHDLRSPLTSILFLAETLLRGRSGPISPLQERQLGLIYGAAFGLSSVASDVVELVRGKDRLMDMAPMPFSIAEIMESVRDIVRPIAEEKGLAMTLKPPAVPIRVGHPVALNRVLLNLTTNALKFTDEGGVEIAVIEQGEDQVEFTVRDTGRGIPPGALALLYQPFRRRQRAREYAFSGSGLGLSICRRFVEAMGGELRVETEAGKGTCFAFTLQLPGPGTPSGFAAEAVFVSP